MRILALAVLLLPALPAQNFQGRIKLPPLVPPLSQPWTQRQAIPPLIQGRPSAQSGPCSIPLLNVMPREADRRMLVPTPEEPGSRMPVVNPPAPPCADASRR
ncbi:MAG: hypothetical protein JST11_23985 [Acidobacteria bacterium]|nr:hypothetical protein [Acidobacteriota bacterium]